jgi:hypothetical protein
MDVVRGDMLVHDLFVVQNRLYAIIWEIKDRGTLACDSIVASTRIGQNVWSLQRYAGKVFHYDVDGGGLCVIAPDGLSWRMTISDMQRGNQRSWKCDFPEHPRAYKHFSPIPLVIAKDDVLLRSEYQYETRNPIRGWISSWFSGGHGWKPAIATDLIFAGEGQPEGNDAVYFLSIRDTTFNRTVVPWQEKRLEETALYKHNVSGRLVFEYELAATNANYYINDGSIVRLCGDVLAVSVGNSVFKRLATLPSSIKRRGSLMGKNQASDIKLDSEGNVFLAWQTSSESSEGVNLAFYDTRLNAWNTAQFEDIWDADALRIIVIGNYIYIGVWDGRLGFCMLQCNRSLLSQQ